MCNQAKYMHYSGPWQIQIKMLNSNDALSCTVTEIQQLIFCPKSQILRAQSTLCMTLSSKKSIRSKWVILLVLWCYHSIAYMIWTYKGNAMKVIYSSMARHWTAQDTTENGTKYHWKVYSLQIREMSTNGELWIRKGCGMDTCCHQTTSMAMTRTTANGTDFSITSRNNRHTRKHRIISLSLEIIILSSQTSESQVLQQTLQCTKCKQCKWLTSVKLTGANNHNCCL